MMPQAHQQFMDDTMLMGMASVREAKAIKNMMDTFKQASGLEINKGKSQLFFFNTQSKNKRNINRILGFTKGTLPSKYLGAPLLEGTATQRHWKELLDRMVSKLRNWRHRALKFPARLTLVKSVLQTLSSYVFSVLSSPKSIIKIIRAIQWNFV